MSKYLLSAVILTKNSEETLADCLSSIEWINEIVIIDENSIDRTVEIAKKFGALVFETSDSNFSNKRNFGAKNCSSEWIFYIDADEKVTTDLKKEILSSINKSKYSGYAIPRKNILLGHEMKHGGWWPDYVLRLIKKKDLVGWKGSLHEQPEIKGDIEKLTNPLIHNSHRSLSTMVEKTNQWSEVEAELLYKSNHPKMTWWRFFSVAFREFWYRGIIKLGFLDGSTGIIEIIYQMYSRMITYAKLWEMQITKKEK
jgi:glycosyltransferase involved in cell wall biosynthesis